MKRIIVSVTNDLINDQRVEKVCNTLHLNGYNILLIGRKLKNSKPIKRPYKTKRLKLLFTSGFLFYAEYNFRIFLLLLFLKKDILLSNDIDTLLPNYFVSKLQNKKIAFDSHELFSEIPELVYRPKTKKVWLTIEKWILPKLKNNYTVCKSIANYYQEKYHSKFESILNLPNKKSILKSSFSFDTKEQKIILYQGAVNIGRGLELLIDSMKFLNNHILVIIGDGDIRLQLEKKVDDLNLNNAVKFLGKIPPSQLHKLTPLANLGVSLEEDLGLNYRYALPNKVFDYIQADVPVLVSDLPEMKKIIEDFSVGSIVKNRKPKELANQIKLMLTKDFSTELHTAKKELIWEKQEDKLLAIFNNLM